MKNIGTIAAALFLTVVLLLYMCTFQVRFTEVAVVKTWGKPAEEAITEPGLKPKWPPPIQTAVVYDKRIRVLEDRTEETRTIDGKNLLVTTFTLWRIADPVKYNTNFPRSVVDGEKTLRTTIVSHKQAVIGKRGFQEFVSTNAGDRKIRDIEREIRDAVAQDASAEFGIEILDFGIKKLGLPEQVTSAIFTSMKAKEQRNAAAYQAEGEAHAAAIHAEAKAAESRILAAALQKSEEIRSEAERVVSAYYKEFNEYPDLRIYLDKLRALTEALRERTTIIIDTQQSPFDIMREENRNDIATGGAAD